MVKYRESEYQKEYSEIIKAYNEQLRPLKHPLLIAFIAITAIIGTVIFLPVIIRMPVPWLLYAKDNDILSAFATVCYFIPGIYFIRFRQIIRHKKRRLKNLEIKKTEAVSCGIFDANS